MLLEHRVEHGAVTDQPNRLEDHGVADLLLSRKEL